MATASAKAAGAVVDARQDVAVQVDHRESHQAAEPAFPAFRGSLSSAP